MSGLPPIVRPPQSAPADLRRAAYERDDYTCQDCGKRGTPGVGRDNIQAHHLVNWSRAGAHTLDNLVTLCLLCHRARERDACREGYRRAAERRRRSRAAP